MSRRDILVLTTGFPRFLGDLFGNFVYEQVLALDKNKFNVRVVAPSEADIPVVERIENFWVHRFSYFWPKSWQRVAYGGGIPTNLQTSWFTWLQLPLFIICFAFATWRRRKSINLVHCHWTISGLIAFLAIGRNVPIVLSVRGSDVKLFNNSVMRSINKFIFSHMDKVIAVSEDLAVTLRDIGVQQQKIRVIANGVSEQFQPNIEGQIRHELGLSNNVFIVLFVGLFVPVKGLDTLVKALTEWKNDSDWLCVLVGDGPIKNDIEEKVNNEGISESFVFAGRKSIEEVPKWMQAADVLVLPSLSEGRPNVVLEAQASGLPVIATRVGGTAELILEGETGFLVEPENSGQIIDALTKLRVDENLRKKMGCRASKHVMESGWTWEQNALKLGHLYNELLEGVS